MSIVSLLKNFVHFPKHMPPLLSSNIIAQPDPRHGDSHAQATLPIPAPTPHLVEQANNENPTMTTFDKESCNITLLKNLTPTLEIVKQDLENLQQNALILLVITIILTVLTFGIQIPALCVTYTAIIKLQHCARVSKSVCNFKFK